MYYLIRDTLTECTAGDISGGEAPYVAILSPDEWKRDRELFSMGIDMDGDPPARAITRALVNYDSLTGSINVPRMGYDDHEAGYFSFALDERGVVFIDSSGLAEHICGAVAAKKRWRMPSLERFLYDFLEQVISPDLARLEGIEHLMEGMEAEILSGETEEEMAGLNEVRGNLLDMDLHYRQLLDLSQELEENENGFFEEVNLRYFRLFTERVMRLMDQVKSLRDYTVQLRELFSTQLDIRMNRIMTVLTIVTAIFMPLTLIAGWYGMNFVYMPELKWRYSYYVVFGVSLTILIGGIAWFRKRKWL